MMLIQGKSLEKSRQTCQLLQKVLETSVFLIYCKDQILFLPPSQKSTVADLRIVEFTNQRIFGLPNLPAAGWLADWWIIGCVDGWICG